VILLEQKFTGSPCTFPTPVTTLGTELAILDADQASPYEGNQNVIITMVEFKDALEVAEANLKSTIGYGLTDAVASVPWEPFEDTDHDGLEDKAGEADDDDD
jgi:hypothetical protein